MYDHFAQMSVCAPHTYMVLQEARRGPRSPTGAINNCEVLSRCGEQNLDLLQEQPALIHRASLLPQPVHSLHPSCDTFSKDSHHTRQRHSQLSCGSINFYYFLFIFI